MEQIPILRPVVRGDEKRWYMCDSKKQYSEKEARKKAKGFGLRSYECPHCGLWHLTKTKGKGA